VLLDHLLYFSGLDVTNDGQHGVVWRVVSLEESANVFDRRRIDFRQLSVTVMRVVPVGERVLPQTNPFEQPIRLVQHVYANLFTHDSLLVLEVLLADVERTHAIRFEPEAEFHAIARHRLVIVCVVKIRMTIQTATVRLDEFCVLKLLHVRRTLKHHVFEQMREAGAALRLEPEADVVIHGNRDHGRGVIFRDHHFETIRKFVIDDRNVE
jgi:hypothetical protein